jgi:excisionase family DNA binding protein
MSREVGEDGTVERQEYFSTGEVAERFGVTTPTVREWIDRGLIPATKRGTRFMISRNDMVEFAKAKYVS